MTAHTCNQAPHTERTLLCILTILAGVWLAAIFTFAVGLRWLATD